MTTQIKVRGYHTDMFHHVNNARYLEFLEEDRWQMLETNLGLEEFIGNKYLLFVVNINISYISQARLNDVIIVDSGIDKFGTRSMVIRQQVFNQTTKKVCANADVTFVISDLEGRPIKIEGALKEKFQQIPALKDTSQ